MKDRRLLYAMVLIVIVAYFPLFVLKREAPPADAPAPITAAADAPAGAPPVGTTPAALPATGDQAPPALVPDSAGAPAVPEDTVVVRSGLYRYALSTRGGRMVSSRFLRYKSLDVPTRGDTLELRPRGGELFATRIAIGADTLRLADVVFQASTDSLDVTTAPGTLTLTGTAGGHAVTLVWRFVPDDFHFELDGTVAGLGSTGGTVLVELGNGFGDTEANVVENHRESGVITKVDKTRLTRFSQFTPQVQTALEGSGFEWVAVKSKYFVAALFTADATTQAGHVVPIAAAHVLPTEAEPAKPVRARVTTLLNLPTSGLFGYRVYLGPMEYDRLAAMGHDFDDVNPYGFAFIRPVVRPFAVAIRALFIGMHGTLGVGYGVVIILFGIMVRLLLWPLNQKAMRSITGMQVIQPELQALQERYKEDPARLQQEMFKLYKEHGVNPFGGCWPMLLPYPLLIAVFFVLQNTIELRGVSFLWMADLSRADQTYVIPVLMAVSMFGISWISQRGMPPNPQAKMMMYIMPVFFLVLFANFASGLNLYYLVQNIAQIPQQMLVNRERIKLMNRPGAGTSSTGKRIEVRTK